MKHHDEKSEKEKTSKSVIDLHSSGSKEDNDHEVNPKIITISSYSKASPALPSRKDEDKSDSNSISASQAQHEPCFVSSHQIPDKQQNDLELSVGTPAISPRFTVYDEKIVKHDYFALIDRIFRIAQPVPPVASPFSNKDPITNHSGCVTHLLRLDKPPPSSKALSPIRFSTAAPKKRIYLDIDD